MTVPEGLAKRAAKAMLEGKYAEAATMIAELESHDDQHAALDDVHTLLERVAIDQQVDGRTDIDKAAREIEAVRSKLRAPRPTTVTAGGGALRLPLLLALLAAGAAAWWFWMRG